MIRNTTTTSYSITLHDNTTFITTSTDFESKALKGLPCLVEGHFSDTPDTKVKLLINNNWVKATVVNNTTSAEISDTFCER